MAVRSTSKAGPLTRFSACLAIDPADDEDGAADLSQPGTFVWAMLEISRWGRDFYLDGLNLSRLLTSKDLMVWEQYD